MNGDGGAGNDLIYIPRDQSEMNFVTFTAGPNTFTPAQQAAAFDAYIEQDPYLSKHRGEYAERGGLLMPMYNRMDLSLMQDIFHNIRGKRNAGQVRLDITNFGNLLNNDWGVSHRMIVPTTQSAGAQVLTNPGVDAQGRANYRLATFNNQLVTESFQRSATTSDVWALMLSFRYSFN